MKTTPVVQSIEDIREHKELLISGYPRYLMMIDKNFKDFPIGDLIERLYDDPDNGRKFREHKELLISGYPRYLMMIDKNFKDFPIGDLIERLYDDPDNFPDAISSHKIAEKVINSKSVFISNSFIGELFLKQKNITMVKLLLPINIINKPCCFMSINFNHSRMMFTISKLKLKFHFLELI